MSVEALSWAFRQKVNDPIAKLVLIAIANHCDEHGVGWPGRKKIAELADCSLDSVDRRVALLCDKGLVLKEERMTEKGDPTSNQYRLVGVAASGGQGVAAQPSGQGSRTSAATMINHQSKPSPEGDIFGDADGNPAPSFQTKKQKDKGTLEELKAFAKEQGCPESDGEALFYHWEGNGWKIGTNKIKDWRAAFRSRKAQGYLASQNQKPNGQHPKTNGASSRSIGQCGFGHNRYADLSAKVASQERPQIPN